ncbi:outer membrane beta-barrel protein [bacterium]|nr:outer membrane beta-barrel protein [bacterium]
MIAADVPPTAGGTMMTRASIAILTLSLLATTATAAGLLPTWGIKGGLNLSNIDMEDIDSSTQTGYVAGLFLDLGSPLLHLQGEVLYTSRKSELGAFSTESYNVETRNHFIEVPVLVKFGLPIPAVEPSLYGGPAVSLPIKSEMTDRSGEWIDVKDYSKDLVWSVIVGVDLKLLDRLILDLRYDIAVTELNDVPVGEIIDDIEDEFGDVEAYRDIKDRTFSVMVGWAF